MFFARSNIERLLRGKKTQTRRLSGRYQVGKEYGVRSWIYEKSIAVIRVVGKRQEKLGAISDADVQREGYKCKDDFIKAWTRFYAKKMGWHPELVVWVYDFELVEAPPGKPVPISEDYISTILTETMTVVKQRRQREL